MNEGFRVGIVGCGGIARAHIQAFTAVGARIAAVCDADRRQAEVCATGCGASIESDVHGLASRNDIDLAVVCTPPASHVQISSVFVDKGIPVLCEKPLSVDLVEARRLEVLANERQVPVFAAFCHRWHNPLVKAKEMLSSGAIGHLRYMRIQFSGFLDLSVGHRGKRDLSGGGALIDNGSHAIDIVRWILGDPSELFAAIGKIGQNSDVEDYCSISLRGPQWMAEIMTSFSMPEAESSVVVQGENGRLSVRYAGGDRNGEVELRRPGSDPVYIPVDPMPDRFQRQAKAVIDAIKSGQRVGNIGEGVAVARIVELAYRSAAAGSVLSL